MSEPTRLTDAALERLLEFTESEFSELPPLAKEQLRSLVVELTGWRHPVYPAVTLTPEELDYLLEGLLDVLDPLPSSPFAANNVKLCRHIIAVLQEARDAS